jgi:hypothetical protein
VIDVRRAVLELLLDNHPALLSVDEVIRAMTADSDSFAERDRVDVAVQELVAAGRVNRAGSYVFASHAAATVDRLWAG